MLIAKKIRLKPTPEQEILFRKSAGVSRWAYNYFLSENNRVYQEYLANGETGVTLNYKTYSRAIDGLNGKEFSMNDVTVTIDNIRAQSFMMLVDATI